MESLFHTFVSPENMLDKAISILDTVSKDFSDCKEKYTKAIAFLCQSLGDAKVDKLADAITRRSIADLFFCGNLGYDANLKNFKDPIARTFMDVDPDIYLRMGLLQTIPERAAADADIQIFRKSLNEAEKELFSPIISYLLALEQDLPRLAHYIGFMLANELLKYTEPGYTPNLILSLRYRDSINNYFGKTNIS